MPADQPSDPDLLLVDTSVGPLAYTDEGAGDGVVLAVPGLPGTVRDYRWLAPLISPHRRVVRIDLPGYGGSPRGQRRGLTTAQRAGAVLALIEALGLGRVSLVSHSSGSTPAVWLAVRRPDVVESLTLLAPTGPRPHYPMIMFDVLAAGYGLPLVAPVVDQVVRRLFDAGGFSRRLSDADRRHTVMDAAAVDFAEHRAMLAAVTAPTLVCWAHDDPVIPSEIVADLVSRVPRSTALSFATGGHNVQKSQAAPIAEAMLEHLAGADLAP